MTAIIVTMCLVISPIKFPLCHEIIAARLNAPMHICADKATSIVFSPDNPALSSYSGNKWMVSKIVCAEGDYQIKDAA